MIYKITPWTRFKQQIARIFKNDTSKGVILVLAVIMALIWANSTLSESYFHLWEQKLKIKFGSFTFDQSFHHLVNDGLMAIFFFLVGLEIKREIMVGALSTIRKAALPVACAIGGMVLPALIYIWINPTGEASAGWGIPMATDIAFALVLINVLGKKVPAALKIFLAALAIADDLGAVLIIAFFYTDEIIINSLIIAFSTFGGLLIANRIGIRNPWFYGLVGILGIWLNFLQSGVHATLAGVLLATAIPTKVLLKEKRYPPKLKKLSKEFDVAPSTGDQMISTSQLEIIGKVRKANYSITPPLQRIEHMLSPFVDYLILPLFALANAGIVISSNWFELATSTVSLGIIAGLVLGKVFGILGMAHLLIRLKISQLPEKVRWPHLIGAACFAGIGFTMSLFIADLAFKTAEMQTQAKIGILLASVIAGLLGLLIFRFFPKKNVEELV